MEDPAAIVCPVCLECTPCACPSERDYGDTLVVRLLIGAHAQATAEIRYLEMRLIDRTGERYRRTEARIWRLSLVRAWCTRQLWRRSLHAPRLTDHEAFRIHDDVESIVF